MKWAYTIKNKLAASLTLFGLCLLVLFSNYIDRNHTDNVKMAISTLYEDRLIAEEYILKMTTGVYQIREVINADTNSANNINAINNLLLNIKEENDAYQKTKFTEVERRKSDELIVVLEQFETMHSNNTQENLGIANEALGVLSQLSTIQLEESKQIMEDAEELYISGKTSSQFVFAIIIVILLVLQAFVFTSKTIVPKSRPTSPHLN